MDEIELKPCPLCGGKAEIKRYVGFAFEQAYVECTNCGTRTKMIDPSLKYCANDKAAELWNRREEAKSESWECQGNNRKLKTIDLIDQDALELFYEWRDDIKNDIIGLIYKIKYHHSAYDNELIVEDLVKILQKMNETDFSQLYCQTEKAN